MTEEERKRAMSFADDISKARKDMDEAGQLLCDALTKFSGVIEKFKSAVDAFDKEIADQCGLQQD